MVTKTNFSLKNNNTFGIDVKAKQYISVENFEELKHILKRFYTEEIFVLGGGSNMLLTKDISKTVIHINTKGKKIVDEKNNHIIIDADAGEVWHDFVMWTINQGFGGLENLALIPGKVGSAPIQNIGAYGRELKDVFVSCEAIHRQTLALKTFTKQDCKFGYRQSVFKQELKDIYIITKVRFKLTKKHHDLKTDYGAIENELNKMKVSKPQPKDIAQAVIAIRQSKLPDPKQIGNSGSFFKNPIVNKLQFEKLKHQHPNIPHYKIDNNSIKIPAGWLIEQSGLKGYRDGDAGTHDRQALVLVNHGNACGKDILELSKKIQNTVLQNFDIKLSPEVNIF
ncbi:UDP-N-acetylmuramate dehydrogenase [Flavobacterium sp. CS20]|uniref:UDP-N-acetylmuramate dehydrogenase n=1 Tax=Flavobacterium sp. CS20 TaxID=2775246 RepID=UPI001B3A1D4E|nr:UDP-N-acetylmuramate dehydrogenase [Flavobacterium sp. CS20]QTY27380.1 UDP-N-acetylmuramate dehydrogenase [Flavobacterium sp. CS20]